MLKGAALVVVAATALSAQAPRGTVVTDTLWSQALGTTKALVVYLPPSYGTNAARRYPVVYYLHGADGDETNWTRVGRLALVMDSLVAAGRPEMIVAMPDGDRLSMYTTYNLLLDAAGCRRMLSADGNPEHDCVPWPHYDDYVAYDVVRHVDAKYRTLASRERRAIAGLSMGGYGAFTLALQYPGTFGAAASHSGVLWPTEFAPAPIGRPLPRSPADSATIARTRQGFAPMLRVVMGSDSAGWYARDPATIAARLKAAGKSIPPLFADAGAEDVYSPQSRRFRDAMKSLGVPLEYREWPGGHDWTYWRAHLGESLTWIAARIAAPSPR